MHCILRGLSSAELFLLEVYGDCLLWLLHLCMQVAIMQATVGKSVYALMEVYEQREQTARVPSEIGMFIPGKTDSEKSSHVSLH